MIFISIDIIGNISLIEVLEKVATILIAAFSLYFSRIIHTYQKNRDNKGLRLEWYKVIILEARFDKFFIFFDNIYKRLEQLKSSDNFNQRQEVNQLIGNDLNNLEKDLISLLIAVDKRLYECVLLQFDELYDGITSILANNNITLTDEENIDTNFKDHVNKYRVSILKLFVEFSDNQDSHQSGVGLFKKEWKNLKMFK